MGSLPMDVWYHIVQIGVESNRLDHVDLCSLAIVNSNFDQLTQEPSLWASLFSRRFPFYFKYCDKDPSKEVYKKRHIEKRERKLEISKRTTIFNFRSIDPIPYIPLYEFHDYSSIPTMEDLSLEESDPVPLHSSEHSSRRARIRRYEKKPSKCFDKSSRPKVIPNSKAYIPMNRPPRRSMSRKI